MAMSRRGPLPVRLRKRARALLLAAARVPRRAPRVLHHRRYPPRIRDAENMRALLYGGMRPPCVDDGLLAQSAGCAAQAGIVGRDPVSRYGVAASARADARDSFFSPFPAFLASFLPVS